MKVPRAGTAISSPDGVTRFWRGMRGGAYSRYAVVTRRFSASGESA